MSAGYVGAVYKGRQMLVQWRNDASKEHDDLEFKSLDDIMVAILCALNLLFGIVNVV